MQRRFRALVCSVYAIALDASGWRRDIKKNLGLRTSAISAVNSDPRMCPDCPQSGAREQVREPQILRSQLRTAGTRSPSPVALISVLLPNHFLPGWNLALRTSALSAVNSERTALQGNTAECAEIRRE